MLIDFSDNIFHLPGNREDFLLNNVVLMFLKICCCMATTSFNIARAFGMVNFQQLVVR